jgi:hypothetical protein
VAYAKLGSGGEGVFSTFEDLFGESLGMGLALLHLL